MSGHNLAGKRIAIYARFSSQNQRETSLEDQVRRCTDYVRERGGKVEPSLIFLDAAVSGASLQRPGFEKMVALVDAVPRGLDVIVTEDMSRISRDFADAASVFKRLQYLDIPLIGVGDGIDTSAQHAKMAFTLKSLMSDMYLDDLRDKTLRGLQGRALAGHSTGGLPLGYRSMPVVDAYGQVTGHRIEVDEQAAIVVRRVFALYLEGRSLEAIAHIFNAEAVPPPRAKTRHRRKGWVASTVRAMLHNQAYVGIWTFNRRQWVKIPGTNIRRPRLKDDTEIIRRHYEDRRIVDETTWRRVQDRLQAVRACYVKTEGGQTNGQRSHGRQNHYVLSGLLRCGQCGAPMTIHAGTSARYYRCSDQKKRGTCSNKLSLREDSAKRLLLSALRDRYSRPSAIAYVRKRLAERLGTYARRADNEIEERSARLQRTEQRIAGIISFISAGDHSDYMRKALQDLEAQAKAEKAAITVLRQRASEPIELPTPAEVAASATALAEVMEANPLRAREQLQRLFEGGRLLLHPQSSGFYVAEGRIDVLAVLTLRFDPAASATSRCRTPPLRNPGSAEGPAHAWSSHGCAGWI